MAVELLLRLYCHLQQIVCPAQWESAGYCGNFNLEPTIHREPSFLQIEIRRLDEKVVMCLVDLV
jgi:hypothetical protein